MDLIALLQMDEAIYALILGAVILVYLKLTSAPKLKKAPALPWAHFDEYGCLWNRANPEMTPATRMKAFPKADNTYAIMVAAIRKSEGTLTAGKRQIKKRHWVEFNGREVEKLELADEYDWMTMKTMGETMHAIGAGLVKMAGLRANDCIIIYAETAREWMLAAQGAFTQGLTVVTIYATLGEEGFTYGAMQTKAKLVVADAKLLKVLGNVFKTSAASLPNLKKVVYIADTPLERDEKTEKAVAAAIKTLEKAGIEVITLDQCIELGQNFPIAPRPPKPSDLAIIMYTSGTTGMPKGVKISHSNVVATVAGLEDKLPSVGIDGAGDVYLAYMPLAHIMEMAGELIAYSIGMRVGYGSPHTLTPTGVKIKEGTCKGDAQVCQPTLLVMAPAILDKVFVGLQNKMKAAKPVVQKLFAAGIKAGEANFDSGGVGAPFAYNAVVFKKVQALLGGKLKCVITGSAPLAPGIQKFAQTAFNCPVRQGYGLTETCASSCIAEVCDNSTGQVGTPTTPTCIKLRDWPEGGYLLSDANDPNIGMPRGEVLIGGAMVCQGYLVDPSNPDPEVVQKNKTDFETDGRGIRFFATGDIGQITPEGTLKIIDRKKDLVKLQQGEYVALSKIENVLKNCPIVEFPMCYAESTRDFCVALICPNHIALKALAKEMGLADADDVESLCRNEAMVAEVSKRCLAACKAAKLVPFETPKRYALVADTFSPDNDILTAAMKLKRPVAAKVHKALLEAIYK